MIFEAGKHIREYLIGIWQLLFRFPVGLTGFSKVIVILHMHFIFVIIVVFSLLAGCFNCLCNCVHSNIYSRIVFISSTV
jgi:hypothetical protein